MKRTQATFSIPWGYLALTLLSAAAGVLLLMFPAESVAWAVRIVGMLTALLFILRGVIDVAAFARDGRTVKQALCIVCDVLALVCGGFFIFAPNGVLLYLFMAAGLYFIIDGSFKLQTTITLRQYRMVATWIVLPVAVACIALGFVLIKFPSDKLQVNMVLLGIACLADALGQLLSLFVVPAIHARRRAEDACGSTPEDEACDVVEQAPSTCSDKRIRRRSRRGIDEPTDTTRKV